MLASARNMAVSSGNFETRFIFFLPSSRYAVVFSLFNGGNRVWSTTVAFQSISRGESRFHKFIDLGFVRLCPGDIALH